MLDNLRTTLQMGYGEISPMHTKLCLKELYAFVLELQEKVNKLEHENKLLSENRSRSNKAARTDV